MALPELLANSPTPGSVVSLTTLSGAVTAGQATITTAAAPPAGLRGAGQFRIIVESEVMIVTAGTAGTTWTVTRGAEGSTAAAHSSGVSVFHYVTNEALLALQSPDALQNGVVQAGDGVVTSLAVSAAGVITGTMAAGTCWVTEPVSGALIRCAIPSGAFTLTPASLPISGDFAIVGVDLVAATAGAAPVLAVSVKGADQTTQALALANPPATAAGRVRLLDVVITNAAGTYSLSTSRDRRPWARGYCVAKSVSADINCNVPGAHTLIDSTNLLWRVECTGVPLELCWDFTGTFSSTGVTYIGYDYDGTLGGNVLQWRDSNYPTGGWTSYFRTVLYPAAGSHLIGPTYYNSAGTCTLKGLNSAFTNAFSVREILQQNANNGTS